MSKKLNVKVNGNPYDVAVGDMNANPIAVTVNGKEYQVEISEQSDNDATLATSTFNVATVAKAAAPAGQAASADINALTAPMPGTILDIAVKAGESVKEGQFICALEAMKMKNMIRSPRAGTIASIEVTSGQKVGFGTVIIRYA